MRVLYYAMGGGLGHLVRARAFLRMQGLERDATVLTASPYASDRRVVDGLDLLHVPPQLESDLRAYRAWLEARFAALQPELVCIDRFPCGILGELCDFTPLAQVPAWYLAR